MAPLRIAARKAKTLRLRHYAYLENTLQKTAQALGLEDLYQVIYGRLSDFDYTNGKIFDDYLAPEIGGSHKGQLRPRARAVVASRASRPTLAGS